MSVNLKRLFKILVFNEVSLKNDEIVIFNKVKTVEKLPKEDNQSEKEVKVMVILGISGIVLN